MNGNDYETFKRILGAASVMIPPEYIQMRVAGRTDAIYRERVFCYELYHQMRMLWDGFPYTLAGEVDKRAHPILNEDVMPGFKVVVPDFLVHRPGCMGNNLVVMEVKPCIADAEDVKKDFDTLTAFVSRAGYEHGVLLVYGFDDAEFGRVAKIIGQLKASDAGIDWGRLDIFALGQDRGMTSFTF